MQLFHGRIQSGFFQITIASYLGFVYAVVGNAE